MASSQVTERTNTSTTPSPFVARLVCPYSAMRHTLLFSSLAYTGVESVGLRRNVIGRSYNLERQEVRVKSRKSGARL
jgi:hypothetical protein